MRCVACNKILSDFEATRKSPTTGEFFDLCNRCYSTIKDDVVADERFDLMEAQDRDDLSEVEVLDNDDPFDYPELTEES